MLLGACAICGFQGVVVLDIEQGQHPGKYQIVISAAQGVAVGDAVVMQAFEDPKDRHSLREWWHHVLRSHGQYSCYAIFLVLPSDKEAIRYLTEFGRELDLISGKNCLIIALGNNEFRRSGFDEELWNFAVMEHIAEGYSVKVAQLFDVWLSEFPCVIIFRDIRSPDHVAVSLMGLTAEEIASQLRLLFSTIQKAIASKENALLALGHQRNKDKLRKAGKTAISELRSFAGKGFETAMEAWINATIK